MIPSQPIDETGDNSIQIEGKLEEIYLLEQIVHDGLAVQEG